MIRIELLVLRKPLNKLLNKGLIRTNHSLVETLVLFIKNKAVFDFI